jgi:hypothetical protein
MPCHNTKVLVFAAPAGKVVYLTDVRYYVDPTTSLVSEAYHSAIDGARTFMTSHYPKLAGKLQQGEYKIMPYAGTECN